MTDRNAIAFGRAPRPESGTDLETRLNELLRSQLPDRVRAVVEAEMAGPNISRLRLSFSGLVDNPADLGRGDGPDEKPTEPVVREPGLIEAMQVHLDAVRVEGVPVNVTLDLNGQPFEWLTDAAGDLWVGWPEESLPSHARLQGRAPFRPIVEVVRRHLREMLWAEAGINLRKLDVELIEHGPLDVSAQLSGRISKYVFSAGATATIRVRVDEHMVAEIVDLRVRSANPLVLLAWAAGGGEVRRLRGERFPLDEAADLAVENLVVETGEFVGVRVELRPRHKPEHAPQP